MKKYNKEKHVKALSRAAMGSPPKTKIIVPKTKKKDKYPHKLDE